MTEPQSETQQPARGQGHAEVPGVVNLVVACSIAVLTLIAVGIAYTHGVSHLLLIAVLLAIAVVGVILELLYYMHLRVDPEQRLFLMFFGSGAALAILMACVLAIMIEFVIPAHP